ncbi:MAG: hypothetical protein CME71_09920 [Halobacteriovorax sp.]|nr:hypothetical protein [Halobacteriovorax sp.]
MILRPFGGIMLRNLISVLALLTLTQVASARVVVISDFDDTVKKANSVGNWYESSYHFLRKKPYLRMRDLFVELKDHYDGLGQQVEFNYVSAAPDFLFAQQKWVEKHGFPVGNTFLRSLGSEDTYTFKYNQIVSILRPYLEEPDLKVIFFGDNSTHDQDVYADATRDYKLDSEIYVRDVSTTATEFDGFPASGREGVTYFFSEKEFETFQGLSFMSSVLRSDIDAEFSDRSLVPAYTTKTMVRRVRAKMNCKFFQFSCRKEAKARGKSLIESYYTR